MRLPAGIIDRVDPDEEKVYVTRTKDDRERGRSRTPPLDESRYREDAYRSDLGSYYSGF